MKIAVIGPGAMGCLFAAYLKEGGLDVSLIDFRSDRVRQLSEKGIRIEGVRGEHRVRVPVTDDAASLGVVDLVMLWVKAHQTERALSQHMALVGKDTLIWTAQNGIGNAETVARLAGDKKVLGGSTTMGANLRSTGHIHHAGEGDSFIGEVSGGVTERVKHIAETISRAGIKIQVSDDIQKVIWTKLLVNVGINALTAILKVRNGVLVEHESSLALMNAAVDEAIQVARSQGYEFDRDAVIGRVREVARLTAANRSSMLQDVLAGVKTEIDYINGGIASLGDYPVNNTLTQLVRAIEATGGGEQ